MLKEYTKEELWKLYEKLPGDGSFGPAELQGTLEKEVKLKKLPKEINSLIQFTNQKLSI